MSKYPIFLELKGRRAVVIGAGTIAARKAKILLEAGARLVLVADKIDDMLTNLGATNKLELIKSKYSKDYLAGALLAIAATNDAELNRQIYKDCQQLEILCNVVDQPEYCDFFVPAVIRRGDLQIVVSTNGKCPAYAGHVKKQLEKIFTEEHGRFLAELEKQRERILKDVKSSASKKALLGRLADDESFEFFIENDAGAWHKRAEKIIKDYQAGV